MKKIFRLIILSVILVVSICLPSCDAFRKPVPVPDDKQEFIGTWRYGSSFSITIHKEGRADISQRHPEGGFDRDTLHIRVAPEEIRGIRVYFKKNNMMLVNDPFNYAREYHIDQYPYIENDSLKIVLNGRILVKGSK